ncbi:MAG: helix-turn-helix domain-containing protein [Desulfatiglandales bacterium]
MDKNMRASSGVSQLDRLLGGLYIGDNVVWHDDIGSLAAVFAMNFIQASEALKKPIIYVTFDRSPKNLLTRLGPLADNPMLTVLDCFTCGKGEGSPIFLKFYEERDREARAKTVRVDEPHRPDAVAEALYDVHAGLKGDVRFVFESVTGMQGLWGGEEQIVGFYSHACPRLYELNTIAYWVMAKGAHSTRLRARINQIAQVAIDLSIKRGKTYLTILKAERRDPDVVNTPYLYWCRDTVIGFDREKDTRSGLDLGTRLKELRSKRGISQTELAKQVGVTPSSISQIESNLIYPSVPALIKMAEILLVDVSSFFQDSEGSGRKIIFPSTGALDVRFPAFPEGSVLGQRLTPVDLDAKAEPYVIEIAPDQVLPGHFFVHKGEEMGYLMSGELECRMKGARQRMEQGDLIYLSSDAPVEWKNPGTETARLLWIKVR